MPAIREQLITLAQTTNDESDLLDFKQEYSPEKKAAFWAETIKDIVAFANTRGGIIVFGIMDDGSCSGKNCDGLFQLDNAAIGDQIRKYTGTDVQGVSVVAVERLGRKYPAILIDPVPVPLVFTKVGTYEVSDGKQKTAFSVGTIYFRHGAKSEPCTREDIAECINRQLQIVREEWLGNIRKVVEAPQGASVVVTQSGIQGSIRLTDDPSAPAYRLPRLSEGYPHRQSEVIKLVNTRLKTSLNAHDIQAIKRHEGIDDKSSPLYVSKPHDIASPQYSDAFVELIISRAQTDRTYFELCRASWKRWKYP